MRRLMMSHVALCRAIVLYSNALSRERGDGQQL